MHFNKQYISEKIGEKFKNSFQLNKNDSTTEQNQLSYVSLRQF